MTKKLILDNSFDYNYRLDKLRMSYRKMLWVRPYWLWKGNLIILRKRRKSFFIMKEDHDGLISGVSEKDGNFANSVFVSSFHICVERVSIFWDDHPSHFLFPQQSRFSGFWEIGLRLHIFFAIKLGKNIQSVTRGKRHWNWYLLSIVAGRNADGVWWSNHWIFPWSKSRA